MEDNDGGIGIVYQEQSREILTDEQWRNQDSEGGVGLASDTDNTATEKQMPLIDMDTYLPEAALTPKPPVASTASAHQVTVGSQQLEWKELFNDKAVKSKDEDDGAYVVCLPCTIKKGTADVIVKMRHPFKINAWLTHCKTTSHLMNYRLFIKNDQARQSTLLGYFSTKKRPAVDSIQPSARDGGRPHEATNKDNSILPGQPVHSCYGVIKDCRSKLMRPLLECWESYGLPGDAYVLGYFGIEQVPQIFAIDCEGAPKALKQRDGKLRCPPCEAVRKARGQGIIQLMKKKLRVTLINRNNKSINRTKKMRMFKITNKKFRRLYKKRRIKMDKNKYTNQNKHHSL